LRHFIQRHTPAGAQPPSISPAAWATLLQYGFPGNVRELSHAVEHAMVLSGGKEMGLAHLPAAIVETAMPVTSAPVEDHTTVRPLQVALREFEIQYLQRALKASEGKRSRTAAILGISRKTLWEKLRNNGLSAADDSEPEESDVS
jgi:two-component system response regulator AtoC